MLQKKVVSLQFEQTHLRFHTQMQITAKYNFINNVTGWVVFAIALITYWLTLEPTVSYWDCGEFITQADKLEIGHPPGNPIFMLTARFFTNFAFGDPTKVALAVNAMSGLLSALTILLLFWTVTHLVGRLVLRRHTTEGMTLPQYLVVMGSGVVGALAYTWSDTFWFSAVEAEVYAFSSFCTALVFWLILKWENRADLPHSDRYLILIAYVIGVSIAVHLLNLLCIPAIVLVFTYRKWKDINAGKSLLALLVGFAIIVLVLFGLVPGFIKVAGWMELSAVNGLGLPFNGGTILYTVFTVAAFIWALIELYRQQSAMRIRISFCLGVLLSGMLFIGSSFWLGFLLFAGLIYLVFYHFRHRLPVRWLNVVMWSIAVIFIGYSSYAVILIRSYANPPLNQSQPDNVFDLSGYLNREQYGETPLLYGNTYQSPYHYTFSQYADFPIGNGYYVPDVPEYSPDIKKGDRKIAKGVAGAEPHSANDFLSHGEKADNSSLAKRGGDYYVTPDYQPIYVSAPSMDMFLPRIHSRQPEHKEYYELWVPSLASNHEFTPITALDKSSGKEVPMLDISAESLKMDENTGNYYFENNMQAVKPTFNENLEFFFKYQVNHMYWRYFLWNFVGRQNDYNNQGGEKDLGNWISGIGFIDDARLGDQSLLPDYLGEGNKAHNKFYFLPLILGIIGLVWQAFRGRKGIEQFWVVFFLFFMTGLAIVLYLNQPPLQPRERDYAFAGSFYAFAIWIGMGVAGLYALMQWIAARYKSSQTKKATAVKEEAVKTESSDKKRDLSTWLAIGACVLGLVIPVQMVSQTWDDHDRSGRYAALDFAKNYLESLEPNAIIFCNGDNDTFPLWYAQEVEGVRPDVKIINLSYLNSPWYVNQQRLATNSAPGVNITATPAQIAYDRLALVAPMRDLTDYDTPVPLLQALKGIYGSNTYTSSGYIAIPYTNAYIPIDKEAARKRGLFDANGMIPLLDRIDVNLDAGGLSLSQLIMLDIIATNAANGWERPIYWAGTVGSSNYSMFKPYLRATGMTYQLVPYEANMAYDTDRSYNIVKNKYRWGGADAAKSPYFDETAGRMVSFTRMTTFLLADDLVKEGDNFRFLAQEALEDGNSAGARSYQLKADEKYRRAIEILNLSLARLPIKSYPYSLLDYYQVGKSYCEAGSALGDKAAIKRGLEILETGMKAYAQNVKYLRKQIEKFGYATGVNEKGEPVRYPSPPFISDENKKVLSGFYMLVEVYDAYASKVGKQEAVKFLNSIGVKDIDELKRNGQSSDGSEGYTDGYTAEDVLYEMSSMMPYILEAQQKTGADYFALDEEVIYYDSLYYWYIDVYEGLGGDRKILEEALMQSGVDLQRSKRLFDEFTANHPEYNLTK